MSSAVIVRSTNISPEPRAEKTARWLRRMGHSVQILGWDRSAALPRHEATDDYVVHRVPLAASYGSGIRTLVPLLRWQWAALRWLVSHRREYAYIHACDFDTVIPSFVAAKLFGKRLVYDIYDFYVDSHYVPGAARELVRRAELWFAEHADGVIIVDRSRLPQLDGARPRRLTVVYNTPEPPRADASAQAAPSREPGSLRVAFVGLLSAERGLMQAIEVVRRHPSWTLDIAGYGGDVERVSAAARALPNATFHGQVPYDRCLSLSGAADVLFATYDPAIPNHRMSSANKLFEAMMLGKPIVVARGTGMDRIVEEHDIGFVVPYGDVDALERAFAEVSAWDDAQREAVARRCRAAYTDHFSSERMFERTAALYADLDRAPGASDPLPQALAS